MSANVCLRAVEYTARALRVCDAAGVRDRPGIAVPAPTLSAYDALVEPERSREAP